MKKLLVITTLLFATKSFAGFLVEPYLGYDSGSAKYSDGTKLYTFKGTDVGGRFGYEFGMIFVAAEVAYGHGTATDTNGVKDKTSRTAYGADVGFVSPFGLRAWAGYNFKEHLIDHDSAYTLDGTSITAGVGYKLSMVPIAFNVQYIIGTIKKLNGVDISFPGVTSISTKDLMFTVSFPFDFM